MNTLQVEYSFTLLGILESMFLIFRLMEEVKSVTFSQISQVQDPCSV